MDLPHIAVARAIQQWSTPIEEAPRGAHPLTCTMEGGANSSQVHRQVHDSGLAGELNRLSGYESFPIQ
jgi:hypothetical protein